MCTCCRSSDKPALPPGSSWLSKAEIFEVEFRAHRVSSGSMDTTPITAYDALPKILPSLPGPVERSHRAAVGALALAIKPFLERELTLPLLPFRDLDVITLFYLSRAYDSDDRKIAIPFTAEMMIACEESRLANDTAEKWLLLRGCKGWRGWTLLTVIGIASAIMNMPYLVINPDLNPLVIAALTPTFAIIGALALAYLGMVFTGTNPHEASVTGNREQNEIHNLTQRFKDASRLLLELYHSSLIEEKALAVQFANSINIRELKLDFRKFTVQANTYRELFAPLEDAIEYILDAESPSPGATFVFTRREVLGWVESLRERVPRSYILDVERLRASASRSVRSSPVGSLPAADEVEIEVMARTG